MDENFENKNESENKVNNIYKEKKENVEKKSTKKSGLAVLIVIIAVVLILGIVQIITAFAQGNSSSNHKNKKIPNHGTGKYVAELFITGEIDKENDYYNQQWLLDTIETLKNDSKNVGIMLFVDSPGGAVYESDEAYLALMDYKNNKPIWAYFGPLAASGAYYISCSAEKIGANRNTLAGSIGVIAGESIDISELMEKHGIKMTTITAGRNKNMGNINSPITKEQKDIMQSIADECYEQFVEIVAESRKLSIEKTKNLADGRIYTANQAKNAGLIDEISSYEDFKNEFSDFLDEKGKITFTEFSYEREKKFYENIFNLMSNSVGRSAESRIAEKYFSSTLRYPAFIYKAE
ncbi:MAG: signal peptide peptidase SppA [Treponemataceae bacterium]